LVKNINHDYWSLPGGKIDKEERPEECLIRELKEELSLSISNIDYKLGEYTSNKEGKQDTIYIFVIKLLSPTFQKQWELEDSRWFPLSNLPTNISPAANRRIIEFQKEKMDLISTW
jgi:8-oxo-dGTP pyrophosphatase MutT (NUDIX family)